MYRTLLVPLDGSPFSERALPVAVSVAQAAKARIVLVHVIPGAASPDGQVGEGERQAIDEARGYLTDVSGRLTQQGIQTETAAPRGEAADGILAEMRACPADMVVMCTHGRSGLGRWAYGSVAEAVLAKSTVPILLVYPTGSLERLGQTPGAFKVLVPLDGSRFAEAALPHAAALASTLGGGLVLLRAVSPQIGYYPDPVLGQPFVSQITEKALEEQEDEAKGYLGKVADGMITAGIPVQQIVRIGWPGSVILDEAKLRGAELIAMSTHGTTGIGERLLGGIAHDVLVHGMLPLLLVRPGELIKD
jgi:nucleotide-binding universal stress UspA family protein